jgi:hypothetical protein
VAPESVKTAAIDADAATPSRRSLPADNPVNAIDWNGEKRRDTGMGTSDLKDWFAELAALDHPIRREFHLFTLLSGGHTQHPVPAKWGPKRERRPFRIAFASFARIVGCGDSQPPIPTFADGSYLR